MREIGRLIGLLTVLAILAGGGAAEAATLKAAYQLQGSRSSEVAGAPDLVDLAPGNVFTTETVGGTTRQLLAFPEGSGVSLATAGLIDQTSFSVVMVFRLAEVSGFRRLLDFSGGSSDLGLYVQSGAVRLYGSGGAYAVDPSVAASSYVQIALTSEGNVDGTQSVDAYVDGDLRAFSEGAGTNFSLRSGILRFFKDDSSFGGEESSGAVACVAVYDGALTPEEVGEHAADPARCTPPPPPPPPP
ncbi:MAG TPA: LamG-like jellyroll fold domain-containing protein, partial [Conexibacter sp.]|nr:LamG-like jellyroll fold domain-containing protein [Conexibacter sp.]